VGTGAELKAQVNESITLASHPHILEGIRRIASWGRIERGIGSLKTRYERHPEWEVRAHEMFLSNEQRALLDDLNEPRTVEKMLERATLADFEACRMLWAFVVIGVVRRLEDPLPEDSVDDEGLAYIAAGG
jgi:hypothetical protein